MSEPIGPFLPSNFPKNTNNSLPHDNGLQSKASVILLDSNANLQPESDSKNSSDLAQNLEPLGVDDPYVYEIPSADKVSESNAWTTCVELGRNYDKDMCNRWKDEIDNLLLFASLFSAVVTSFIIESYKLLRVDQQEVASAVLLGMHHQLDSILRQSGPAPALVPDPALTFTLPKYAVAINVCLFLSLTLSLSVVSIGILCLQWLREYLREPDVSHQQIIAIRHFRLRGIHQWKVAEIIGLLPLALQASLFLFFVGLLLFLWNTNEVVAIVVCCAVGVTVFILVATSLVPGIQSIIAKWHNSDEDHSLCPYRSPQAWVARLGILSVGLAFVHFYKRIVYHSKGMGSFQPGFHGWATLAQRLGRRFKPDNWPADDVRHVTVVRLAYSDPGISSGLPTTNAMPSSAPQRPRYHLGVAWGLASVPQMHLHNVPALCALIHCAGDLRPDQMRLVLERMGSNGNSLKLRGVLGRICIGDKLAHAMGQSLSLAFILDSLAEKNAQFKALTFSHRFELFLRMLNRYAEDMLIDPYNPPAAVTSPPKAKPENSSAVPQHHTAQSANAESVPEDDSKDKPFGNTTSTIAKGPAENTLENPRTALRDPDSPSADSPQEDKLEDRPEPLGAIETDGSPAKNKVEKSSSPPKVSEAEWWALIQQQATSLFQIYWEGDNARDLIPEELQIEVFRTVCRYIERAPFIFAEYLLVSAPMTKSWFLPLPSEKVVKVGDAVNKQLKRVVEEASVDPYKRGNILAKTILYALRMSARHTEYTEDFSLLVRAIRSKEAGSSTWSETFFLQDEKTEKLKKEWDSLVQKTAVYPMDDSESGTA